MKTLVTGGAGFIGSHIQDKLLQLGHDVIIIDKRTSNFLDTKSKFIQLDIANAHEVNQAIAAEKPEAIFHLAAQTQVPYSMSHPHEDEAVNIGGMINILEAAKNNDVKKVIYSNTGGAFYGEVAAQDYPIKEDHLVNKPTSFYGVSKLCAEYYLKLYGNLYGLQWISLRYSNVYGPRQEGNSEAGVIAIFLSKMLKGEQPTINGDGSHTRDYVFVSDVAEANIRALEYASSDYFNISIASEISNKDLYFLLKKAINYPNDPNFGPTRPGDVQRSSLDNSKAKQLLQWTPQTTLEQGIQQTINYYKKEQENQVV
jgi:UDP-glucose 4-epimerase